MWSNNCYIENLDPEQPSATNILLNKLIDKVEQLVFVQAPIEKVEQSPVNPEHTPVNQVTIDQIKEIVSESMNQCISKLNTMFEIYIQKNEAKLGQELLHDNISEINSIKEMISENFAKTESELISLKKRRERNTLSTSMVEGLLHGIEDCNKKLDHISAILDDSEVVSEPS